MTHSPPPQPRIPSLADLVRANAVFCVDPRFNADVDALSAEVAAAPAWCGGSVVVAEKLRAIATSFGGPSVTGFDTYAARLARYGRFTPECAVVAVALLRKLQRAIGVASLGRVSRLPSSAQHRLLLTACIAAVKLGCDTYERMPFYANVGGVPLHDLLSMELALLILLDFDLHVSVEEFDDVLRNAGCDFGAAALSGSSAIGNGAVGAGGYGSGSDSRGATPQMAPRQALGGSRPHTPLGPSGVLAVSSALMGSPRSDPDVDSGDDYATICRRLQMKQQVQRHQQAQQPQQPSEALLPREHTAAPGELKAAADCDDKLSSPRDFISASAAAGAACVMTSYLSGTATHDDDATSSHGASTATLHTQMGGSAATSDVDEVSSVATASVGIVSPAFPSTPPAAGKAPIAADEHFAAGVAATADRTRGYAHQRHFYMLPASGGGLRAGGGSTPPATPPAVGAAARCAAEGAVDAKSPPVGTATAAATKPPPRRDHHFEVFTPTATRAGRDCDDDDDDNGVPTPFRGSMSPVVAASVPFPVVPRAHAFHDDAPRRGEGPISHGATAGQAHVDAWRIVGRGGL